jgi:hypothetical protein
MFLRLHQLPTTSAVRRCGLATTQFDIMLQAYASHIYLMWGWGPVPDLAVKTIGNCFSNWKTHFHISKFLTGISPNIGNSRSRTVLLKHLNISQEILSYLQNKFDLMISKLKAHTIWPIKDFSKWRGLSVFIITFLLYHWNLLIHFSW